MQTEQVRGFAPKVRAVVRERVLALRTMRMLEEAPATRWTKDGKLKISTRQRTFRRANKYSSKYGVFTA